MENYETLAQESRDTFGAIDCTEHLEKRNQLDYLKWTFAVKCLMDNFPESNIEWEVVKPYEEATTYEVLCTIELRRGLNTVTRNMFLPIMDFRHKAITNPTSRDINDAKWRAFVKCMAVHFNLGLEVYNGGSFEPSNDNESISDEQVATIYELIEDTESDIDKFCEAFKVDCVESLTQGDYERALQALNKKKEKGNA